MHALFPSSCGACTNAAQGWGALGAPPAAKRLRPDQPDPTAICRCVPCSSRARDAMGAEHEVPACPPAPGLVLLCCLLGPGGVCGNELPLAGSFTSRRGRSLTRGRPRLCSPDVPGPTGAVRSPRPKDEPQRSSELLGSNVPPLAVVAAPCSSRPFRVTLQQAPRLCSECRGVGGWKTLAFCVGTALVAVPRLSQPGGPFLGLSPEPLAASRPLHTSHRSLLLSPRVMPVCRDGEAEWDSGGAAAGLPTPWGSGWGTAGHVATVLKSSLDAWGKDHVVPWARCLLQVSVDVPQISRRRGHSGQPRLGLLETLQDTILALAGRWCCRGLSV